MPSSKRSPPAAAANRGCINERQWSDIRRAAALAQEKGVRLTLHGVSVMPADSTHAGGSPQRATAEQAKAPRRANDDAQPPETRGGVPSEAPSKKRQRDAQRLAEHRERQRVAPILARWALLARQPLRAVRRIRRDEVWTGWRREATERKQEARRKLRDVLRPYAWQEWTRRHIEVPCTTKPAPGRVVYPVGRAALSPLSMRDEFILKRTRALWSRSFKFTAGYKPIWSWRRRFEGNELRNPQPSCDRENDFLDGNSVEHRHAFRGQLATPARSGGKKRAGGRKS